MNGDWNTLTRMLRLLDELGPFVILFGLLSVLAYLGLWQTLAKCGLTLMAILTAGSVAERATR